MNKTLIFGLLAFVFLSTARAIDPIRLTNAPLEFVSSDSWSEPTIGVWMQNDTNESVKLRFTSGNSSVVFTVKPKKSIWFFGSDSENAKIKLRYAMLKNPNKLEVTGKQVRISVTSKGMAPPSFSNEAVIPRDAGDAFADLYATTMDITYPLSMNLEIEQPDGK